MNVLRILGHEHGLIRQYLDNLQFAVERLERGEKPPVQFFENAVLFARDFVDKYHHFKEEHQMFRLLAEKAGGEFDGPIDSLRYQHERGRHHVGEIANALEGYDNNNEQGVTIVLENAAAFCSLLRQHVNREDHIFYPMARRSLTEAERDRLLEEFERSEENLGRDFFELSAEQVEKMSKLVKD
jgi:hemerythrin-like domain-containing protein